MARTIDWRHGLPTWLAGKTATVTVGGNTVSGVVELAAWSRFAQPFVEFTDGRSVDWQHDDDNVTLTVAEQ